MIYLVVVMSILMIIGSAAVLFQRTLRKAALISGIVSLMAAGFFVIMKAYDVAITEASIGAMLTTALYFFSIKRIEEIGGEGKDLKEDLDKTYNRLLKAFPFLSAKVGRNNKND